MLLAAPAGPTTVRCETHRSLLRKRDRTARGTGADGWAHDGGCAPPAADRISLWIGRIWRRSDQMSGRLIVLGGVGRVAGRCWQGTRLWHDGRRAPTAASPARWAPVTVAPTGVGPS